MKVEVGKWYRQRNGKPAVIIRYLAHRGYHGFVVSDDDRLLARYWDRNGTNRFSSDLFLVSELTPSEVAKITGESE